MVWSEKLTAHDFLGHKFLHDAATAPYEISGARFSCVTDTPGSSLLPLPYSHWYLVCSGRGVGALQPRRLVMSIYNRVSEQ